MKMVISVILVVCVAMLLVPQSVKAEPFLWPPEAPVTEPSIASVWAFIITFGVLVAYEMYEAWKEKQFYEDHKAFIDAGCVYNKATDSWDCGGARCY
jgi:hypothetical protein